MTAELLKAMGERIRTEDNRATGWPIYVVQRKRRVYGFDPDFGDEESTVWLHCDGPEATAEERKPLDEAFELYNDVPSEWTRTSYQDTWEFVQPFFTEAGANEYIRLNKHNLGEARVFVESAYRNPEWQAVREYLRSLA